MAKADFSIARLYAAALVPDAGLRDRVFGVLEEEFERTRKMILTIPGNRSCWRIIRCCRGRITVAESLR